ncbi:LppU/SCO3897 family protein [Streptomyces albiaxialis]|uniref:LppU/SCO3897 family protein n=1 Tax=Streptomyces albiaxialis TaxID=329523 RepID=UPI0031D461D6
MKKLLELWRGREERNGQEEPPEQGDPDDPEERARRGRWRLLVAGALFATLILPKVVSSASYTDPALAQPSPSGSASTVPAYPSSGPTSGPTVSPSFPSLPTTSPSSTSSDAFPEPGSGPSSPPTSGAPSPTRAGGASGDPAADAFRAVRAGHCLTVHSTGKGWSRAAPTKGARVGCGSDRAYVRVTSVRDDPGSCPDGNGRDAWSHTAKGRTVALCLTRQYRVDECLLADGGGGEMRAALMSAPACGGEPSKPYDRVLRISSIHAKDAGSSKGLCARGDKDRERYWTWRVDGGRYTLCAREA